MTIYEHRASLTAASGAASTTTLTVPGGLCRQVLIRANTATTLFSANLTDENSTVRRHYGFHRGEINDMDASFPMVGEYTLNITNASADDIFSIVVAVQER